MKKPSAEKFTIVLAWADEDFRVVRERRTDMGERPELETFRVGKSVMWLNRGTEADVEKAKVYARSEKDKEIRVFAYPTSNKDPLGTARRDVLRAGGGGGARAKAKSRASAAHAPP